MGKRSDTDKAIRNMMFEDFLSPRLPPDDRNVIDD
jgi:hypothetical protein